MALFGPGVFEDDEVVLYLDLDVLVVGDLAPFPELLRDRSAFYTLREWNPALLRALPVAWRPDRGSQGSVYVWRAGEQRHVFADFTSRVEEVRASYWSDRFYLPAIAKNPQYLPYDWCLSFKNHCLTPWPLNLVRPGRAAARGRAHHRLPRQAAADGRDGSAGPALGLEAALGRPAGALGAGLLAGLRRPSAGHDACLTGRQTRTTRGRKRR